LGSTPSATVRAVSTLSGSARSPCAEPSFSSPWPARAPDVRFDGPTRPQVNHHPPIPAEGRKPHVQLPVDILQLEPLDAIIAAPHVSGHHLNSEYMRCDAWAAATKCA
jgi:hypothetical protein